MYKSAKLRRKIVYGENNSRISYQGVILSDGFEQYLSSRVKEKFYDVKGYESLIEEFQDVASTGFEKELLVNIFSISPSINDWKIGEALAVCYLEDFEKIRFHYPPSRDARNPRANLQGADLVGFIDIDENTTLFLFGEVKTSGDKSSPPQVMYGESGMIEELRRIKNDSNLREGIIKWLGFKVKGLPDSDPFKKDYQKALKIYIKEDAESKYFLLGILVRDTTPKDTDLKSRYNFLKKDLSKEVRLKLIALYIPISIKEMRYIVITQGEENE